MTLKKRDRFYLFELDFQNIYSTTADVVDATPVVTAVGLFRSDEFLPYLLYRPVVEDIEGKIKPLSDAFLGRIQIPTCGLLYKTTGMLLLWKLCKICKL